MRVLLLEDNLMWSVRTKNGLQTLGHDVIVMAREGGFPKVDLAIVNLGSTSFDPFDAIPKLKEIGIRVIGHVGHKDKELWKRGEDAGCDKVVSNGTLAKKLKTVVSEEGESV